MGNTLSTRATEKEGGETSEKGEGHQVPAIESPETSSERILGKESFERHQSSAQRLPFSQEARTFVDLGRYGVLSTLSAKGAQAGFPNGSVVGYAAKEEDGLPIFAFSTLSSHTTDLNVDGRCSLTVTAPGFQGASDGRVTLTGKVLKVSETDGERSKQAREAYKSKHPDAFWVDFGDFSVYEMTELVHVRLVGGFARAGNIKPSDFMGAEVDQIMSFSEPVCGHMNADHSEEVAKYVKHYTGLTVDGAKMLSIDHIGMNVEAEKQGRTFKVRLPYPEPAKDRKAIKEQIVIMSRAAATQEEKEAKL
jgi:putative heme iron utilization protein